LGGTLSFAGSATTATAGGSSTITPGGLTSSNYAISFASGTLQITPAALTVTADNKTKAYGTVTPAFTVQYTGFVNGDTPTALGGTLSFSGSATTATAVGSSTIMPGGLTAANYAISFASGTLQITPAALTVTADNKTKAYGTVTPAFTVQYTGFVNGDTPTALGGTLSFSRSATTATTVGSFAIMPGGLTAPNYAISFASGTLQITPAALTVTADNKTKAYGTVTPAFTVQYTGFVNGDTPTALGGTLSFSGSATTATTVGSFAIMPGGLTSANYAISFASGTLQITPAALTVTADNRSKAHRTEPQSFTVQ